MVATVTVLILVVGSVFVAALVGFWVVLSVLHCCRPQRRRIEHEDLGQHAMPEDRNPLLRAHQDVVDVQDELARQDEERERERLALERERAEREKEERERREKEERERLAEEEERARQIRLEQQRWELEIKAKIEREEREKAERAERERLKRETIEAQLKADRERLMQEDNERIARERERIECERREEKERKEREREERERAEAEARLKEQQEKEKQPEQRDEVATVAAEEKQVRLEIDPDAEQPAVKLRFKDDIEREQAERESCRDVPESNEELFTAEEIQIMNTTRKYIVLATYDWLEPKENQISFKAGERIWVAPDGSSPTEDYWFGEKKDGTTGYFPKAYVRPLYRKFTGPPKRRISTKVLKVQNRLSQKGLGFG